MPELPDITAYIEALRPRIVGSLLRRSRVISAFLLRTFEPPIEALDGRTIIGVERLGKRIVIAFDGELFAVIHPMIAGRLRWLDADAATPSAKPRPGGARPPGSLFGKIALAEFQFDRGVLGITESSQKKRASLHIVAGRGPLSQLAPVGLDVRECSLAEFESRLRSESRTLKRALTTPRLFDGIGNAYSDEILHAARLSPTQLTGNLDAREVERLFDATRHTLDRWTRALREKFGLTNGAPGRFPGPGEITAFRPDFAVHGKFGQPCPACDTAVQRIVYAENECNYCPRCQTAGKLLADRSMSRLLKEDWPRTIDELENGA